MEELIRQSGKLSERLGLKYEPVGFMFEDRKPEGALGFKKAGGGCIAPLIFNAAKGKTVAFDRDSTGYPCSAFYLGYTEWIFPGIEYFLSKGPLPGRECEFFVRTPEQAKEYVQSLKSGMMRDNAVIFKPLNMFGKDEKPLAVILFANPDQMSALVFLAHFNDPCSRNRIETGFASACISFFTMPLQYALKGEKKAFWGLHDIAVRSSFPADITSLSMPVHMYREICSHAGESFLYTENWEKLLERIKGVKQV
jgi:uncharacterized protein (DUF169 family)